MSGRPRGFAPWTPRAATRELLDQVAEVLETYRDHLPMTLRQVFYRLVSVAGYPKSAQAYERLGEHLNRARRAGLVPWSAIRDDGTDRYQAITYSSADQYLDRVQREAAGLRMDRQDGQPRRLWLLCEAAGMGPMLARVANPLGVPVITSGGFDSVSAKYRLARELAREPRSEVLQVGDHDFSGVHILSALAEDVGPMAEEIAEAEGWSIEVRFSRLAVLPEQIAEFGLPTAPPNDKRRFEGMTVQAEALPPDALAKIVREAIESRQVGAIRSWVLKREEAMRKEVVARLRGEP